MPPEEAPFEDSCGFIQCGNERGTGFLVGDRQMVTCWHVVAQNQDKVAGEPRIKVDIGGRTGVVATLALKLSSEELDVAVLELSEPVVGIKPLPIVSGCHRDDRWIGCGYPMVAMKKEQIPQISQIPLHGTVRQVIGHDSLGKPAMVLECVEAAGGTPMGGVSGSPVIVNGRVVGHVKRILEDPSAKGHPLFGFLYAVRGSDILRSLGWEIPLLAAAEPGKREALLKAIEVSRHSPVEIFHLLEIFYLWDSLKAEGVTDDLLSVESAEVLIRKGRSDLGLKILNEVLPSNQSNARMWRLYAQAKYQQGHTEEAVRSLEDLAEKDRSVFRDATTGLWLSNYLRANVAAALSLSVLESWLCRQRVDGLQYAGFLPWGVLVVAAAILAANRVSWHSALLRARIPSLGLKLTTSGLSGVLIAVMALLFVYRPVIVFLAMGPNPFLVEREVTGEVKRDDGEGPKLKIAYKPLHLSLRVIGCRGTMTVRKEVKDRLAKLVTMSGWNSLDQETFTEWLMKQEYASCEPVRLEVGDTILIQGQEGPLSITPGIQEIPIILTSNSSQH